MRRRVPLRNKTWMRRKKNSTSYARRPRDREYMASVRGLPCALGGVAGAGRCRGPVEADHMGEHGLSHKADDRTCAPLCSQHHRDRHAMKGFFAAFDKQRMRAWCKEQVARAALAIAELAAGVAPFVDGNERAEES